MVRPSTERPAWRDFLEDHEQFGGWEGEGARILSSCRSIDEIRERLADDDPNIRIMAIRTIASSANEFDDNTRMAVIHDLWPLLGDQGGSEFAYGGYNCDEEEIATRIADVAHHALQTLDPDWRPKSPR